MAAKGGAKAETTAGEAGSTRERIFAAVRAGIERGRAPSLRELRDAVGLRALESVRAQLEKLAAEGRLVKESGARGWRLPGGEQAREQAREQAPRLAAGARRLVFVPVLGRVPAGSWSEAVEEREGEVGVDLGRGYALRGDGSSLRGDGSSLRGEGLFALRVVGESMRDAAILDGDLVVVDTRARARSGDIVVARLDGEATVKRLFVKGRRVELRPANPAFAPIVVAAGASLEILGKVVEVRRHLEG